MLNLFFIAICCLCFGDDQPQSRFVDKYIAQYNSEAYLRPADSLVYIPNVMNLETVWNHHKNESVHKKLFKYLSRGRIALTYPLALDIINGESYHNPMGDMDYWEKESRQITLIRDDITVNHEKYTRRMQMLIKYVKDRHPDYLFKISGVDGIDFDVFWVIIGRGLYAVQIGTEDGTVVEYEASDYVDEIAPDYVFSPGLRLDKCVKQ